MFKQLFTGLQVTVYRNLRSVLRYFDRMSMFNHPIKYLTNYEIAILWLAKVILKSNVRGITYLALC